MLPDRALLTRRRAAASRGLSCGHTNAAGRNSAFALHAVRALHRAGWGSRNMNFVTQPSVELYKSITGRVYGEAKSPGASSAARGKP